MSATVDAVGTGHIGARGLRLGSALLDAGIERLEGAGCAVIELSVTETNTDAQRLYLSRGFEFTGTDEALRDGSALRNLYMRRVTDGG